MIAALSRVETICGQPAAGGAPPSQIVGSSGQGTYSIVDGVPTVTKEAKIGSIDDQTGKPANFRLHTGSRPILAFGDSDGLGSSPRRPREPSGGVSGGIR